MYKYNESYANIPDANLIELLKMRLENENWKGRIDEIFVLEKKNALSTAAPFCVTFSVDSEYGNDKHNFMFKRFYINELDYIHDLFERLHFLPVSEYVFKKRNEITNLECSNRGWASACQGMKDRIKILYDSVSF